MRYRLFDPYWRVCAFQDNLGLLQIGPDLVSDIVNRQSGDNIVHIANIVFKAEFKTGFWGGKATALKRAGFGIEGYITYQHAFAPFPSERCPKGFLYGRPCLTEFVCGAALLRAETRAISSSCQSG